MDSLYSISQRYNAVMALLDDDSIPPEDIGSALILVNDELQKKGENILSYLQKLDDIEEQAKRRKKEIDAYIKGITNRKKRLEKACIFALDNMQIKSIMTSKGEIKTKKNPPSVVIDDYSAIPGRYISTKIDYVVDRKAIKAAIKAGEEVQGVHLEQGTSLSY